MGFKPKNCLKKYYHVKPGSFIYPDENVSMTVFKVHCLNLNFHRTYKY